MLQHPNINPIIFSLGPIEPRWYGLMYIISFALGWFILKRYNTKDHLHLSKDDLMDVILFMLIGVVVGGRLGYVWFYNFAYFWEHPKEIFAVWNGGMSFHGGFLGSLIMILYFAYSRRVNFYKISDILVIAGALGIGLVRFGNFLNGELFGRASDLPWCMVFPAHLDPSQICRHPSQLYEMLLEGFLLLLIVLFIKRKKPTVGITTWSFIAGYGLFRTIAEFFREPDQQIGYYFGFITQGQLLSFPMFLLGFAMVIYIGSKYGWKHNEPSLVASRKSENKIKNIKKEKKMIAKKADKNKKETAKKSKKK